MLNVCFLNKFFAVNELARLRVRLAEAETKVSFKFKGLLR